MKKVLLIFEDFQDSGQTQTDLKKVGFDILAMNTTARLSDQILTFRPDVVVGNGGPKLSSLQIGKDLKAVKHFRGKSVLILPNGERPNPADLANARVDVLVEAPVQPRRLIEILAKLTNTDPALLLEKFSKAKIQEHAAPPATRAQGDSGSHDSDMVRVRGNALSNEVTRLSDKDRVAGYQNIIKGMTIDIHQTSHSKAAVKARQEELKKGWDSEILEQFDNLKKQFAEALFKKGN